MCMHVCHYRAIGGCVQEKDSRHCAAGEFDFFFFFSLGFYMNEWLWENKLQTCVCVSNKNVERKPRSWAEFFRPLCVWFFLVNSASKMGNVFHDGHPPIAISRELTWQVCRMKNSNSLIGWTRISFEGQMAIISCSVRLSSRIRFCVRSYFVF